MSQEEEGERGARDNVETPNQGDAFLRLALPDQQQQAQTAGEAVQKDWRPKTRVHYYITIGISFAASLPYMVSYNSAVSSCLEIILIYIFLFHLSSCASATPVSP